MQRVAIVLFALGGVLSFWVTPASAGQTSRLPSGLCDAKPMDAPLDFTLQDIAGNTSNLATYRGRVLVVNFWATWCGPCKAEVPLLTKLQQTYGEQRLTVIGLSLDNNPESVKDFARKFKINYPVFVIGTEHPIDKAYGPRSGVPVTFVIGADGQICRRHLGAVSGLPFENRIRALVQAAQGFD